MKSEASEFKNSLKTAIPVLPIAAAILLAPMKLTKRAKINGCAAVLAAAFAFSSPAQAHHGSRASYQMDVSKALTLAGTVTEYKWGNPHVYILFDVTDDKGNVVHWGAETNPPFTLAKHGWTKDMLKPGDQITITVYPSKAGTPVGLFSKMAFNGRTLSDEDVNRAAGAP